MLAVVNKYQATSVPTDDFIRRAGRCFLQWNSGAACRSATPSGDAAVVYRHHPKYLAQNIETTPVALRVGISSHISGAGYAATRNFLKRPSGQDHCADGERGAIAHYLSAGGRGDPRPWEGCLSPHWQLDSFSSATSCA